MSDAIAEPLTQLIHGSAVAFEVDGAWHGVLIIGQSGAGKSELALQLMALGAQLLADDQTRLTRAPDGIVLQAPAQIAGWVEMRGIGIMPARSLPQASLKLVVDLDHVETQRLPAPKQMTLLACQVPLLHKVHSAAFVAAIRHYILSKAHSTHWSRP